jgi:NAD(P)H-hydrate epimerase
MHFLTAHTMRALDAHAIAAGTPADVLMERAGYGAFCFLTRVAAAPARRILLLAGKGNNGGDAFVVARYLFEHGRQVHVVSLALESALRGEALQNWQRLRALNVPVEIAADEAGVQAGLACWHGDLVVDGILGTGAQGVVQGLPRAAIDALNAQAAPVLALDMPSGLDATTGAVLGAAVRATWTVTFGHAKRAMLDAQAAAWCGRVEIIDIGLPRAAADAPDGAAWECLSAREVGELLPQRTLTEHKNRCGHVLVVAGSRGMSGAAVLCAQAALRAGAGLVTVATPASLLPLVAPGMPAGMTLPLDDDGLGVLTGRGTQQLCAQLAKFSAVACGPGLGQAPATAAALALLLAHVRCPLALDADALNLLAAQPALFDALPAQTVLTPHPGEFARLCGGRACGTTDAERVAAAQQFAEVHKLVLLLKGFHSVIAAPGLAPTINLSGNPGMATAGAGDVLAGVVAALLGQGLPPRDAARGGAYLHGVAGDIAAAHTGQAALTAPDVSARLGNAWRYCGEPGQP